MTGYSLLRLYKYRIAILEISFASSWLHLAEDPSEKLAD